jgi:DNA-binding CsgD family transcriptional regulator
MKLSDREKRILEYASNGYRLKEIAEKEFCSLATIKRDLYEMYDREETKSLTHMVAKALRKRLIK